MAKPPKFEINQASLDQIAREAVAKLQPQYNAALQDVVRSVRDEMEGRPVDQIFAELERRLRERFGDGFEPNPETLQTVAEEISEGTLEG